MTRLQARPRVAVMFAAVALLATAAMSYQAAPALAAGPNQTAQGIMVNLHADGTFTVVDNKQYEFDEATAATYFTNATTGGPTVTCTGSPTNCAISNQPATPDAPAPDPSKVNGTPQASGAVQHNQCTFLDGGSLSGLSYTQSQSRVGVNGKGNWTFTWTYAVTPTTATVDPLTAWNLVREVAGPAEVPVTAAIAGESVLAKSNGWKKYSFSLTDSTTGNRVQNLALNVTDSDHNVVWSTVPESRVVANVPGADPGDAAAVDFPYTTNAGSNGAVGNLQNGDARTILNTDSFVGNDDGGADGSALALALMEPQTVLLGAGDYTVTLTGTVKGNSGIANISFSVGNVVHIIAPGCGNPAA
jgi:hypothetical protein